MFMSVFEPLCDFMFFFAFLVATLRKWEEEKGVGRSSLPTSSSTVELG